MVLRTNTWNHGLRVLDVQARKNSGGIIPNKNSDVKKIEKIKKGEILLVREINTASASGTNALSKRYKIMIRPNTIPVFINTFFKKE